MQQNNFPRHVAIIMDGNGRWAKRRGLARNMGHRQGSENLVEIARYANQLGLQVLTVFAFSTENWTRPTDEVHYLMKLPLEFFKKYAQQLQKDNIRLRFIGLRDPLSPELKALMADLEQKTEANTGMTFIIALNYGGRDEMIRAFHRAMSEHIDLNEANMIDYLDTKDIPDVDLLIRTSGEMRISNFLLWQTAYSELLFTETLWPDFHPNDLDQAISEYMKRSRRYGGLK